MPEPPQIDPSNTFGTRRQAGPSGPYIPIQPQPTIPQTLFVFGEPSTPFGTTSLPNLASPRDLVDIRNQAGPPTPPNTISPTDPSTPFGTTGLSTMFGTGNPTGPGSQAGSSSLSDPVEIVYHFIRLLRPETVETQKINTQADGTTYLRPRKTKHIDEEINAIAEVLAETQFNTLSSNCVLTPHGYANRGLFKPALIKIEAQNFKKALTNMLQDGAFIYKASTISEQVVGVAVITRIAKDFPIRTHPPRAHWHVPPPIPDVTDVMAVDTYARSQYMETELGNQWRIIFNSYREQNNPDRLWELSSVGVKEAYRRQDIGRTLCRYALSLVPIGDWVLVQSEPTTEVMFQHLGFYYAVTKDNQFKAVNVAPEWEEQGALKQFRLMTFQKPHQRLDAQALRGFQPPNQSFMVL